MVIKYFVCGLSYDKDNQALDYECHFDSGWTSELAAKKWFNFVYNKLLNICENKPCDSELIVDIFSQKDKPEVAYWALRLEKCEVHEDYIECIDVPNEIILNKEAN